MFSANDAPGGSFSPALAPKSADKPAEKANRKVEITELELLQIRPGYVMGTLPKFQREQPQSLKNHSDYVDKWKRVVRLTDDEYRRLWVDVRKRPKMYRPTKTSRKE